VQSMRRIRSSALIRWGAVFAWMTFIFYLSAQPSLPRLSDRLGAFQSFAGHILEYAVLALLLRWSLAGNTVVEQGNGSGHVTRWAFVLAAAYGITDEVHQHFVPGRHMDPFDLLTDAAGAAFALWIVGLIRARSTVTSLADEGRPTDLS
jgi:VanZ family protein